MFDVRAMNKQTKSFDEQVHDFVRALSLQHGRVTLMYADRTSQQCIEWPLPVGTTIRRTMLDADGEHKITFYQTDLLDYDGHVVYVEQP